MRAHRIISLLLALTLALALFPCPALATSEEALLEQVDAIAAQIVELLCGDPTFEYKGETYHMCSDANYANEHFAQTEDYYPFFDALMEAHLAYSDEIGALYLQEVALLNQFAVLNGYDNYMTYACQEQYVIHCDPVAVSDAILSSFPKSAYLLESIDFLATTEDDQTFLDQEAFLHQAAALYGELCPDYQPMLEELIGSDALLLETTLPLLSGGSTVLVDGEPHVTIQSYDDLSFAHTVLHEFGHALHDMYDREPQIISFPIEEIHAVSGTLLCADRMEALFREWTGDSYGAFLTLRYLLQPLIHLPSGALYTKLCAEILTHPEDFQPRDIAKRYLDLCLSIGYDGGYSPEYQMLVGAQWMNAAYLFTRPFYAFNYVPATANAVWLWREQETGGDAVGLYNALVQAPISDMHYPAYCTQMGLPPQRIRMPARGHNFLFNRLTALFNGMGSDRGARANRRRSCCFSHGRRPYHFFRGSVTRR